VADGDARRVPAREGRGEVREKGSRFFAFAARVGRAADAEAFVARLEREHHDATHVAFAWKIGGESSAIRRASDAGEPAGTAGRPILAAIDRSGLADVAVAVVRHFGGTKLGTGGLVRAYRSAAERALADGGSTVVYHVVRLRVRCPFDRAAVIRRLLDPPAVRLVAERFEPDPVLDLEVRASRVEELKAALAAARLEASEPDSGAEVGGSGAGR
jgi:uncharacterized YigZ family protein